MSSTISSTSPPSRSERTRSGRPCTCSSPSPDALSCWTEAAASPATTVVPAQVGSGQRAGPRRTWAGCKLPLLSFSNPAAFRLWLAAQPLNSQGAWIKFAKKGAAEATLNKSDAIDLALAHGWIDGQLGSVDEFYFKTRFTPRKPKSAWSKINCERVEKLIELGQMTQQGLAQVDAAKADGRWEAAYPSQSTATPHADLQAALDGDPSARRVFDNLDSANRYSIVYRVHQAKTAERREAKIVELMAMLRRGETIHPRRAAGSSS